MSLLISFLIGIQMLHLVAASSPFPFLYPSCNSLVVKAAAEVALDKLNADRSEGYILALQRIYDAREIPQRNGGSLFYLTLDVLETECYVLTGKQWKECKIRDMHETIYGQCKVIIHFNRNSDHSHLYSYHCDLRPLCSSVILDLCPDCPMPGNLTDAKYQQTTLETLAKFNAENEHNHYFVLVKVTKASSQWVIGLSYFVEYLIQETSCHKSPPVSDITRCPLLPVETAERGLCKGSVMISEVDKNKFVTVKCEFFPHLPPVTGEQTPQSESRPGQEEHQDDGERHRDENQRHHHHSHLHHHKHHGQDQEDQKPHQPHPTAGIQETPSKQKKPVGQVIIHPSSSKNPFLEMQEPNLTSGPTLASPEQEGGPHSAKPAQPTIPPFPRGFSKSAQCPGDTAVEIPGLQLPSQPQAETS
ncbi:fetuin-B [Pituophis catenifer annectens]|uniref:fetuin-B n=1 Tax=Pituophis catenifer annectens TaxID=94852 RepID=UPI003995DBBB